MFKDWRTGSSLAAATAALTLTGAFAAQAAPDRIGWVKVGSERADYQRDLDVYKLDILGGKLDRFRMHIQRNTVAIYRLKLVYEDGRTHKYGLPRRLYGRGERTRTFRNPHPQRSVAYVEIGHRTTREDRGRQATVMLYGKQYRDYDWQDPPHEPTVLGSLSGGWGFRTKVLRPESYHGRFRGLKLRARNRGVVVSSVRVTFSNGATRELTGRRVIFKGATTDTIDLPGIRRRIEKVTVRLRRMRSVLRLNTSYGDREFGGRRGRAVLDIIGVR